MQLADGISGARGRRWRDGRCRPAMVKQRLRDSFISFGLIIFACCLAGCAANGPASDDYSAANLVKPAAGKGVVFGKRCEGGAFTIRNVESGETIPYYGTYPRKVSVFAMQLPPGVYALHSLAAGGFPAPVSRAPFLFTVREGTIAYIGTIIKSWSIYNTPPSELACEMEARHITQQRFYHFPPSHYWLGMKEDSAPDSRPVYVADYIEGVIPELKVEFPKLELSGFVKDLMR